MIIAGAFVAAFALTASMTFAHSQRQSRSLLNATGVVNVNSAYTDNYATAVSSTGNDVDGSGFAKSGNADADATAVTVSNVNVSDVNCTTCGDNDAVISATGAVNVNEANTGNGATATAVTGNKVDPSHHSHKGGVAISGNADSDVTAVTVSNVNLTKVGGRSSHR